jgi:hypothetical protein
MNAKQMAAMQPFFPASTLDAVRLTVLAEERVSNPTFYGEPMRMGFEANSLPDFAHMAAITNRVLFHELVHVVQYEKLPEWANSRSTAG